MNYSIDWDSDGEQDWDYDGCDHDDYDIDIINGRCLCYRCGESWYADEAQILAAIDHQAAYAEREDRENRQQWWRDLWSRMIAPFQRLRPRRATNLDDEIPF